MKWERVLHAGSGWFTGVPRAGRYAMRAKAQNHLFFLANGGKSAYSMTPAPFLPLERDFARNRG